MVSKYTRGCSQKATPIRGTGLTITGVPGGSSGKNRVYSILDKIRIANKERYSHHNAHPNQDNVVNNIKSFNNRRLVKYKNHMIEYLLTEKMNMMFVNVTLFSR